MQTDHHSKDLDLILAWSQISLSAFLYTSKPNWTIQKRVDTKWVWPIISGVQLRDQKAVVLYRKISRVCCRLYCYECATRITSAQLPIDAPPHTSWREFSLVGSSWTVALTCSWLNWINGQGGIRSDSGRAFFSGIAWYYGNDELLYEPSILLHIETHCVWLAVPDTDSRVTSTTDTVFHMTCSTWYGFSRDL